MDKVIRLKQEYREEILATPELQGKIAGACKKSMNTVWRWCKDNSEQLTMLSALNAIRDFKKLSKQVELTESITLQDAA